MTFLARGLIALALALPTSALGQAVKVDSEIGAYEKTSGVAGSLSSVGSDTLNNLMTLWAEGFRKQYPNVKVQIEGKGSSTAPPALIAGTAQLGPMSRQMKATEVDEFEARFGYKPTLVKVAIDALAVYVNKDNPLSKLTIPEVDAVFSKSRRCGFERDLVTWNDVMSANGSTPDVGAAKIGSRPVSLYGRNSASGTYGYFKKNALCKGDYKDTVKEQPGSASVVQGVTEDLHGIGYSGIGYKTSGVKALALAKKAGGEYGNADPGDVYGGKYPLSRFLYVYVNKPPNRDLDPLISEFLEYVLSQEGQTVVVKDGYLPLSSTIVGEEQSKL